MKMKTSNPENSARMDRIYEKPVVRLVKIATEGVLCFSAASNIQSYDEEEFSW